MSGQRCYRDFYENLEEWYDRNSAGFNFRLQGDGSRDVSGMRGDVTALPGNEYVNPGAITVATSGDNSPNAQSCNGSPCALNNTARSTMTMSNGNNTCGTAEASNFINNRLGNQYRQKHGAFQNNQKSTNSNQSIYHNFNRKKRSSLEDNYTSNRVQEVSEAFINNRRFNLPACFNAPEPKELPMPPVDWRLPRRTDKLENIGDPHYEMSQLFLTSPRKQRLSVEMKLQGKVVGELIDMEETQLYSSSATEDDFELRACDPVINNSNEDMQSFSSEPEKYTEDDASSYASALENKDDDFFEPVYDAEIRNFIMTNFEPKEVLSADERAVIGTELEQALHGVADAEVKAKIRMAFNKSISYIEEKTLTAYKNGLAEACSKIINGTRE